ncbi:DUF397 domain-containing protein [Streptomyces sp. NPDC086182]|uniref:DUF397 domain-containing protein n=1 Tax=Streptomyces sp. NPDC086182 TaxID=3155058 RepID=UPI003440887B
MTHGTSVEEASELKWFKSTYSSSEAGDCVEVALEWFKSSYSDSSNSSNSSECVEVALEWFKSSYSDSSNSSECVEIAPTPTKIHLRDSKNPQGPHLTFASTAWAAFLPYATQT